VLWKRQWNKTYTEVLNNDGHDIIHRLNGISPVIAILIPRAIVQPSAEQSYLLIIRVLLQVKLEKLLKNTGNIFAWMEEASYPEEFHLFTVP
jgi:hypothetical protein